MDLRTGQSLWTRLDAHRLDAPPLRQSIRCDVLIVGSGITGALIAFHLAEQNINVAVVDRRNIASGSTPASTALIQYDIDTPLVKLRKKLGKGHADTAYKISRKSVTSLSTLIKRLGIKCDLARRESLFLAHAEKDLPMLKAEFHARREIGMEVEYLTGPTLRHQFKMNRSGAILSRIAYQLDPLLFTRRLLVAAQRLGARIFAGTTLLPAPGDHLMNKTDDGHTIAANHVVWATGYETPEEFPEIKNICELNSTYVIASRPNHASHLWPKRALIWETGSPYLYARTAGENRIIIGGLDEPFQNPKKRDALISAKSRQLLQKFNRIFSLAEFEIETAWTGTFAQTEDGLPYIGQLPAHPCCHFALGYGGNGITFSLIAAEIIRDGILNRPNPASNLFSFKRTEQKRGRPLLAAIP